MKKPPDCRSPIDQISEMLNCPPGQVPERVAELLERQRARPASEPPPDKETVLTLVRWSDGSVATITNHWIADLGLWSRIGNKEVVRWWPLPPMTEEME